MELGIDVLLKDASYLKQMKNKRIALLGHPASVNKYCIHTVESLFKNKNLNLVSAFGPQHGMMGDKQDNMIESDNYSDPVYNIPVFSLYGKTRRPDKEMMNSFDILIVDIQDIGTRVYTFITTLLYMMEECSVLNKKVIILDRPNPAGRPVEGTILEKGWESFVGEVPMIMRHGLTIGEIARYFVSEKKLNLELKIIKMLDYNPEIYPNYGWPQSLSWINPSPNATGINMARCYPGTVLFEGTSLSEGRGTTKPLELFGSPDIDNKRILNRLKLFAEHWIETSYLRLCWFEPTFDQFKGQLCSGIQIHTDNEQYIHYSFKPFRIVAGILKSVKLEYPDYDLWRDFAYEYESERLAIDLINGGEFLREWVDNPDSNPQDLEKRLIRDEKEWSETRKDFLIY